MPRLNDLRKKFTRSSSTRPLSTDEDLVDDARFSMTPVDFVERKLRIVMESAENFNRRAPLARKKPK